MENAKRGRRLIVVGDVHGQLEPFARILYHAGLVDSKLNWKGGYHRLLQIGDIYDRGPHAKRVDTLLTKLQTQAAQTGGEVIRLVGNHELELLMGNYTLGEIHGDTAEQLREQLTQQVANGQLRAAHAYKGYLFTHAGVTRKLYKIFQLQLQDASAHNLAVLINLIFKESIKHQFFKHPIFNISLSRNGTDHYGGIFWEDLQDLLRSYPHGGPLWQVVGHTQVDHIAANPTAKIIPVDVGLHHRLEYFVIDEEARPQICEAN